MRSPRASVGALIALTLTLTLTGAAACGSSSTGSRATGKASTSAGSSQGAAADAVKQFLQPPSGIPITTPLSKKPAAGKTLIVTENPEAVTRKTNDGLEIGAKLLGWTVKRQPVGSGPEDPAKAFDAALDQKPDAVLVSGNPASMFRSQLARATRMGIPVLMSDTGDPVGKNGTAYTIALDNFDQTGLWGKMTADYVASKGAKHVLVVDLSLYPILHAYTEGVVNELKSVAPDTKSTVLDAQITDLIAGKIPANVVSEIQRSPDIDWVILSLGDMSTGMKAALSGAGLGGKVKIGGESASTANVTALKKGEEDVWTGFAAEIHGMYRIDDLARIFNGESLVPDEQAKLPTQLLTQDNIGSAPLDAGGYYVGVPDYVTQFKKLWKLTS